MRKVLMVIFLVACSMTDQEKTAIADTEEGRWRLVEVDGKPASGAAEGYLQVDLAQSRITGNVGCNDFQASFKGAPAELAMGSVGGTKKLCPGPIMEQERRVYEILSAATSITVDGDGMLHVGGARGYLRAAR